MSPVPPSPAWCDLLAVADRLRRKFRPHRIEHLLDARGRHELELPSAFPLGVSLFKFREGAVSRRLTWHRRLELLMPLDGPLRERMGDLVVELEAGDVLVVDHLKPHQVVDTPGLATRVVVLSFDQECVFGPGSPPADYAFLVPFHRQQEGPPRVLRSGAPLAAEVHAALAQLLRCYFDVRGTHREAGCKAWLLVLLHGLIRAFRGTEVDRPAILRRQEMSVRLRPVLDHVRLHYSERLPLAQAAALCGMSPGRFGRVFRETSGMTLVAYVHQVRMARAVELLADTDEPISSIASRLGFSDQSHFDRRFRRWFGRTPSGYRMGVRRKG